MKLPEDFLHYIWRFKQLDLNELQTVQQQSLQILDFGQYNTNGGADFLNAKVVIDGTIWAGNVEMHVQSSDWLKHQHQNDPAYNSVVLHVVFEDDAPVHRNNGERIPTLELHSRIDLSLKNRYLKLLHEKKQAWIPCASQIQAVSEFTKSSWLDRVLIERLEEKTRYFASVLERNNQHWETTFYELMARSFGLKINTTPFERLAQSLPLLTLAKHKDSLFQLEALLFGQAGFLAPNEPFEEDYPQGLQREYQHLQHKYQLQPLPRTLWQFLRLRPSGFPTIRIALFAALIHQSSHLFSKILKINTAAEAAALLKVQVSEYWQTHYVFGKASKKRNKSLGKATVQTIVINAIIPCLFLYGNLKGDEQYKEKALALLENMPPEKNSVIEQWKALNMATNNAADTQALLHLKKHYCEPQKCLHCGIGHAILKS